MFDLSEQELESYKKVFQLFDKDRNGTINREEMAQVFDQLNIKLTDQQIDDIFKKFDQNGNYSIQFEEFVSILSNNSENQQNEAWLFQVFQIIDQDSDGRLSKSELMKVITLYDLEITEKEVNQILQSFQNGEGKGISYEQFSSILKF